MVTYMQIGIQVFVMVAMNVKHIWFATMALILKYFYYIASFLLPFMCIYMLSSYILICICSYSNFNTTSYLASYCSILYDEILIRKRWWIYNQLQITFLTIIVHRVIEKLIVLTTMCTKLSLILYFRWLAIMAIMIMWHKNHIIICKLVVNHYEPSRMF